jgi:hypothetical protein
VGDLLESLAQSERIVAGRRRAREALWRSETAQLLRWLLAEIEGTEALAPGMIRLGNGEIVSREELNAELARAFRKRLPEERAALAEEIAAEVATPREGPREPLRAFALGAWRFEVQRGPDSLARRIVGTAEDGSSITLALERRYAGGLFSGLTVSLGDGRAYEVVVQRAGADWLTGGGLMTGFTVEPATVEPASATA